MGATRGTIYDEISWDQDDWAWDWTAGVMVSMPITDLLVTAAKVKEARAEYTKARVGALDTANKIKLDIKGAYYDLVEAREIVDSQRLNIEAAEEAVKIAEVRYDNGISTLLGADGRTACPHVGAPQLAQRPVRIRGGQGPHRKDRRQKNAGKITGRRPSRSIDRNREFLWEQRRIDWTTS